MPVGETRNAETRSDFKQSEPAEGRRAVQAKVESFSLKLSRKYYFWRRAAGLRAWESLYPAVHETAGPYFRHVLLLLSRSYLYIRIGTNLV